MENLACKPFLKSDFRSSCDKALLFGSVDWLFPSKSEHRQKSIRRLALSRFPNRRDFKTEVGVKMADRNRSVLLRRTIQESAVRFRVHSRIIADPNGHNTSYM